MWKAPPSASKIDIQPRQRPTFHLRRAQWYCLVAVLKHYENFFVLGPLTPRHLALPLASLYAFCRYSDDIADETDDLPTARKQLNAWEEELRRSLAGEAHHPITTALAYTVATYHLPEQLLFELLSAFRQDLEVFQYLTFADLRDYSRRSADPVGRLVLRIYGFDDPELDELSDAVCTGLQLANFCQDVGDDARRGRLYIPIDECRQFEVDPAEILELQASPRLERLLHYQVVRAYRLLQKGAGLSDRLEGKFRRSVQLFVRGGLQILDNVRQDPLLALRRRVKVTKRQKLKALREAFKNA